MATSVPDSIQKPKHLLDVARVAVVGCGAVATRYHLPVLAGHEGFRLATFIDRDLARARELARQYGVPQVAEDVTALSPDTVDAAVVSTPAAFHAEVSLKLLAQGIHVFVEKPMAFTEQEARRMVETADENGVTLSVGLFRRLLPCTRLLRAVLDEERYGRPLRVDVEDGGTQGWAAATLGNMRREWAGGGVLMDMGSHILDRLVYLFPSTVELVEYRDNSQGGIESDCLVQLQWPHAAGPIEGRVELSRTRELRNTLRVECEQATLELRPSDRYQVHVLPGVGALTDTLSGTERGISESIGWADDREESWFEPFRAEFDDWLNAMRTGTSPQLSGLSSLRSVALIEECYRRREPLHEPIPLDQRVRLTTQTTPLNGHAGENEAGADQASPLHGVSTPLQRRLPEKILITGATGFIGCRLAEILSLREGVQVRALINNPGSAGRLARLPVEMVQANLRSPEDMRQVLQECDGVVHCAIGTSWKRREAWDVTVNGTRCVAAAAKSAGVKRFVHLSSIAIHGNDVQGVLDETTPIQPPRGDTYSESKTAAEKAVSHAARAGLSAVILRPTNVFGPFSKTFITRPVPALAAGQLCLVDAEDTPSNTIYVDNLVEAILAGLCLNTAVAPGEVFTIAEDDSPTWGAFYGYFAERMGRSYEVESAEGNAITRPRGGPLAWLSGLGRGMGEIALSAQSKALAQKILDTRPIGTFPRYCLDTYPGLERGLRNLLHMNEPEIYRRPAPSMAETVRIRPRNVRATSGKARRVLAYSPAVPRDRAMEVTWEWVKYARLV